MLHNRHSKNRHDKVLQELNGAPAPAPVDIEELGRVGRHAEVRYIVALYVTLLYVC